jgi:hypothetical protein
MLPSIGINMFSDIVFNCEMLDGKTLKLTDVDLEFVSTVSGPKKGPKNQNNPDRALVRY